VVSITVPEQPHGAADIRAKLGRSAVAELRLFDASQGSSSDTAFGRPWWLPHEGLTAFSSGSLEVRGESLEKATSAQSPPTCKAASVA
jgi:hypothetical protein